MDGDAPRLELFDPESGAAGLLPFATPRGARLHHEERQERGASERGDRQLEPGREERRAEAERHERGDAQEEAPARTPASSREQGQSGERRGEEAGGERRDGPEEPARQQT